MTEDHFDKPYPIRERIGEGMFTDREQEMAFLMKWADYARNGFTEPAQMLLQEQAVLWTNQAGLVQFLQDMQIVEHWTEHSQLEAL